MSFFATFIDISDYAMHVPMTKWWIGTSWKGVFYSNTLFLMLALLRRTSFWPPSMVEISVINTHITNYNLFHLFSLKNYRPCRDLPCTKPICYQLSYPGLDDSNTLIIQRTLSIQNEKYLKNSELNNSNTTLGVAILAKH